MLKSSDKAMLALNSAEGSSEERKVRKNMSQSLMLRLQAYSQKFRRMQQTHLNLIQKLQPPSDLLNLDHSQDSLEEADDQVYQVASDRSEAIHSLVQNLQDLAEVFKDLSSLIVEQGNILDRIDFNIEQTLDSTEKANKELDKALKHQSCARSAGCIICLVVLIIVAILGIALKHFP
jgi:syntaxin 16